MTEKRVGPHGEILAPFVPSPVDPHVLAQQEQAASLEAGAAASSPGLGSGGAGAFSEPKRTKPAAAKAKKK